MKRYAVIFLAFSIFFSSCSLFGNHISYREITVSNNDIVERTVVFTKTKDNSTGDNFIISVNPGSKVTKSITGPYTATSRNRSRYTVTKTDINCYEINPVLPTITTFHILNRLPIQVTLKDKTYTEWTITIPESNSVSKDAQLYSDEVHDWYIDGAQIENSFTYIMDGANKVFFTLSIDGNKIIIE